LRGYGAEKTPAGWRLWAGANFARGLLEDLQADACRRTLALIFVLLEKYAREHEGRRPENLGRLVEGPAFKQPAFICAGTPEEQRGPACGKLERCDFLYLPIAGRAEGRTILAFCPAQSHGGRGRNVLYSDGTVKWVSVRKEFQTELLETLAAANFTLELKAELTPERRRLVEALRKELGFEDSAGKDAGPSAPERKPRPVKPNPRESTTCP
jgi:hypothetical protein